MIPVIELTGSYYSMGHDIGQEFGQKIIQFAQTRMARLIDFVKLYGKVEVSEQEVLSMADSLLDIHKQYDADLWQEFTGIAEGASISLQWLLVATAYTDLRDYICKVKGFNDSENRFEGCTAFILDKSKTADNNLVLGQTWDMSIEAMDYLLIVKKNPNNGPKMMYLTTMGAMALIGLNSNKLAIGTTNLMANDSLLGVNYLFTITKALMANNYTLMTDTILNTKRLSGHSFLCAGPDNGNLIETSSGSYINHNFDQKKILVKTNHYFDKMHPYEIAMEETRRLNSIYRYERACELLDQKSVFNNDELWQVLADNKINDNGAAICNEDYIGKYGAFVTCATALLLPEQQQIWVCQGGAFSGKRQIIDL